MPNWAIPHTSGLPIHTPSIHGVLGYLLQGQKGRLEKAIFECVLLAGSLLTPLLSSVCVLLAMWL